VLMPLVCLSPPWFLFFAGRPFFINSIPQTRWQGVIGNRLFQTRAVRFPPPCVGRILGGILKPSSGAGTFTAAAWAAALFLSPARIAAAVAALHRGALIVALAMAACGWPAI